MKTCYVEKTNEEKTPPLYSCDTLIQLHAQRKLKKKPYDCFTDRDTNQCVYYIAIYIEQHEIREFIYHFFRFILYFMFSFW